MNALLRAFWIYCLLMLAAGVATGQAIHIVNTTDDTDDLVCNAAHCSLREAINASNTNIGPDSIAFNIPGPGDHVIAVQSPLPAIRDSFLTIDGTTQPLNFPMNGKIIIDGSALSGNADHGFVIYTRHTRIFGLQIRNFPGDGIQLFGGFLDDPNLSDITIGAPERGNVIIGNGAYGIEGPVDKRVRFQHNYIGTDLSFNPGLGNAWDGIFLQVLTGEDVMIGGAFAAEQGNYLCSNGFSGIRLRIEDAAQIDPSLRIAGNRIGTDITTLVDLGNAGSNFGGTTDGGGIAILGEGALRIGGGGDSTNVIAYNPDGIYLDGVSGKTLYQNQFLCNTTAGIRLENMANDGIEEPNSLCVGPDAVQGRCEANARVDVFFHDASGCAGVPCQGRSFLGTTTADASGAWTLNAAVPMGTSVTAVATNGMGSTSAFSSCSDMLEVIASNTGPYCQGDTVFLMAEFIGTPSNPTFEWSGPGAFESTEQNPTGAMLPGLYLLVVRDGNCVDTAETVVEINGPTQGFLTDICIGQQFVLNGNVYDINNTQGMEILEGANRFGCDSIVLIDLQFNESIEARLAASSPYACVGDTVTFTVEIDLGDPGPYELIYTDGVNPVDTLNGVFDGHEITRVVTQTLSLEMIDLNASFTVCDPIIGTSDTVFVSDIAVTGMISDFGGVNVTCANGNDGEIDLNITGSVGDLTFDWNQPGLSDSTETGLSDGVYSVTVTDASGCSAVFDTVLVAPDGLEPVINVMRPSCVGATDGSIVIDDVANVDGTLLWSPDSMTFVPVSGFPLILDMLPAGQQFVYFTDDSGCVLEAEVFIPAGDVPLIDIGSSEISILSGDSVQLNVETDLPNATILWEPGSLVTCQTCPDPLAFPTQTQFFRVTLQNDEGCVIADSVLINVFTPKRVYIPNVFSPNRDQVNDFFYVQANDFAVAVDMLVVERGGVVVYDVQGIPPNVEAAGWDGTMNGQLVNPGVYAYLIRIHFSDGSELPYSGTVTVVR
ncbi:MAG: gliding motility-associated C-terminal domain-containing protein [Saprospiraceae bacterium]|nr:gliding motility-associated C-terminal domain-containing protein [Saprospiraceae bacterium]